MVILRQKKKLHNRKYGVSWASDASSITLGYITYTVIVIETIATGISALPPDFDVLSSRK